MPGQPLPSFIPLDWSPDGQYLAGWQHSVGWGIVIYSFATQRYERLNETGSFPVWLKDSRRLIFREGGELFLIDRLDRKSKKIFSFKASGIGSHVISRDNQRLYFTETNSEADIWLLSLK